MSDYFENGFEAGAGAVSGFYAAAGMYSVYAHLGAAARQKRVRSSQDRYNAVLRMELAYLDNNLPLPEYQPAGATPFDNIDAEDKEMYSHGIRYILFR